MMEDKESNLFDQNSGRLYLPPPEPESQEIHLRYYLLAVLNRRWMILTLTVLVVLGTGVYSFLKTPMYRSKAVVDIDLPGMYVLLLPDSASQPVYLRTDSFINTQIRILQGRTLARSVAEKLNLKLDDLKKIGATVPTEKPSKSKEDKREAELSDIVSVLLDWVNVLPVPSTNLCEITFTTPDANLSMKLANAWAEEYVQSRVESMQQYTRKAEELLMEQVKDLQTEIDQKEKELHRYSSQNQVPDGVGPDSHPAGDILTDAGESLNTAKKERISAQVRYQALSQSSKESIPEVFNSPAIQDIKKQYAELQQTYNDKLKIFKPNYPEMVRIQSNLEQLKQKMVTVSDDIYKNVLSSARGDYEKAVINEKAFQQQWDKSQAESIEIGRKEHGRDKIRMEIDTQKQLLTLLLQKRNATDVTAQVQEKNTGTTRIMEVAELPKDVFSPNIQKNILISLLGGFVGSLLLALLLDYFDRSLKTPEDVENQLHLPFFGLVPYYFLQQSNGRNGNNKALARKETTEVAIDRYGPYHLSIHDAGSSASEAVKTVRTSLLLAFPGAPPRSILVTSSRSGEGKTFIASNLAIALTQLEKRVVIVDADMRNPHIHRVWNMPNNTGLSIYLTSNTEAAKIIRPTSLERLSIISSGPKTPRPAELLASNRFTDLMKELEAQFDFVIVDSPPVLPVTDSVILASRVKSVVLVVRGGATPRDIVKMAKKKISTSNSIIAGVVLNGIDLADPYYYYRYYSDYYSGYYAEDQPHADAS